MKKVLEEKKVEEEEVQTESLTSPPPQIDYTKVNLHKVDCKSNKIYT